VEKYPYSDWFDGRVWELIEGVDFESKRGSMIANVINAAKRRGIKVEVRTTDAGIAFRKVDATTEAPALTGVTAVAV
jgi:hypothetical protein